MALKTLIEKIEDVPEAFREHYTPVDKDKPEAGFSLGLQGEHEKSKISEFRNNNINLQKERDGLAVQLKQFDGIDPAKHKKALDALAKIESTEEQQLIADGKLDEVLQNRTQALRQTYDEQLQAKTTAYDELKSLHSGLETAHAKLKIGGEVQQVLAKTKLKPRGTALQDILSRVHGTFRMQGGKMVAKEGDQQLFGPSGNPLTIEEHLNQMAADSSHLFEAAGGGSADGEGSKTGTSRVGGKMIIDPTDTAAVGKYLADITSGKAKFKDAEI